MTHPGRRQPAGTRHHQASHVGEPSADLPTPAQHAQSAPARPPPFVRSAETSHTETDTVDPGLETAPVLIAVDAPKVERIVENLLANAARHTPAGTPVWVRVQVAGRGALMVVEDAGPGVPAEVRQAIFQPFRQGPTITAHAPGSGIGLALVVRFAGMHGGRAWVQERPGGGASFRVFLPDVRDPDAAPPPLLLRE
jgi:signal transduction histidine kinase